jgi:hypothetical protein
MNSFLRAIMLGPPCAEVATGMLTEPRPTTDSEREINAWRRRQFRARLAAYIRRQDNPDDAEITFTRQFENGLILLAAWNARWRRREKLRARPPLHLASRQGVR